MTVGIVGLGLIGGSFAKAYHAAGWEVLAHDADASTLSFAQMSGAVDAPLTMDNISACDLVLVCIYPLAAVEYLRQRVAGFNMGSLGYVAEEDAYRQSMSGLPLRLAKDTWALDPNNAGFYYRTNAYEEYTPYLRTDISTMKFFFDEDTSDRIVELESVLKDYIENNIAKFVTGARSLDEFDTYLEEVKRQGAEEYVSYYAQAYEEYMANLAK